jgi:hypothetical protein
MGKDMSKKIQILPVRYLISVISVYAFPFIWNTVNPFTASVAGQTRLTSIRFFHWAFFATRYQAPKGRANSR